MSHPDQLRGYPPIDSYGFLSDTHTGALVGADLAVDWMCVPRFDGPSIFARMLDRRRGGSFRLVVSGAGDIVRRYVGDSFVLESTVPAPAGSLQVQDVLAVRPNGGAPEEDPDDSLVADHRLVRLARATGTVTVTVEVDARPDYGRAPARWSRDGRLWRLEDHDLWLWSDRDLDLAGDRLTGEVTLGDGEVAAFVLGYAGCDPGEPSTERAAELVERSRRTWQAWSDLSSYDGLAREHVLRSALVLRALAFDESGAGVAAPTTSLPEWVGGERNWDYRFTWHRDASLAVMSLFRLGHPGTGRRYLQFLLRVLASSPGLRPMAGIRGEQDGEEHVLEHLSGYADSPPVRVGNEAFEQYQLETYGHVLDAALAYQRLTGALTGEDWDVLCRLVDFVAEHWREPDDGIWEVRGPRQQYVNSKVLAWVCLDRGVRLAEELGGGAAPAAWQEARDDVHRDVLERGYDTGREAFTISYESAELDASNVRIPLVGFLPGDDPRVVATLDRVIEELDGGDALIKRYDTERVDDGLEGPEGAFLLCSFEVVAALVLAGRVDEARARFDRLCAYAGPLGLFSEQVAPDGTALGNFPQAFSHLGLIEAALNLEDAGSVEALHAWTTRGGAPPSR